MFIETIAVGVFQCNCTVLACDATKQAIVVDPGDEPDRILEIVRRNGLSVSTVVHTHAHLDHLMGTLAVVQATGAVARIHHADVPLWRGIGWVAASFGIPTPNMPPLAAPLADGDTLAFGQLSARVLHTPGHTPGSCCLAAAIGDGRELVLTGDTLFRGRIGITDLGKPRRFRTLPADAIVASIRDRLLPLGDDTRVIPGHGAGTTIGEERRLNPFLSGIRPQPRLEAS